MVSRVSGDMITEGKRLLGNEDSKIPACLAFTLVISASAMFLPCPSYLSQFLKKVIIFKAMCFLKRALQKHDCEVSLFSWAGD